MINNLRELFQEVCSTSETDVHEDRMKSRMDKAIYRGTECGAWISHRHAGVAVGSIVEGCDHDTEVHELLYPFDKKDFWGKLEEVEQEVTSIWNNTHGCESCYPDNPESTIVNPECSECEGLGTII